MKKICALFAIALLLSCNSQDKRPLVGKTAYQVSENARFKDASRSPLKKKDLKNFKGLDFYPVDSAYIVTAKLLRTPDAPVFVMPTTGENWKPRYKEYGILSFTLKNKELKLTVYHNQDDLDDPKKSDMLFLLFTDDTNSDGSYGGGRYMDLFISKINPDDTIELNFNNTYNPYCAYDEKYACPIVPRKNHLDIAVKAGVKDYKKK